MSRGIMSRTISLLSCMTIGRSWRAGGERLCARIIRIKKGGEGRGVRMGLGGGWGLLLKYRAFVSKIL
jgi:hypothetical protein